MKNKELPFRYCPACGAEKLEIDRPGKLTCLACGFHYYQNNAAAVALIIEEEDEILMICRGKEPGKGLLDLPGGFVDPGECAEDAVRRELMEELKMEAGEIRFFESRPNRYPYKGVLYHTCDLFFIARCTNQIPRPDAVEVTGWERISAETYDPDRIAFDSVRNTLSRYFRDRRSRRL